MTATANEEDVERARSYIADCCAIQEDTLAHDIDRLVVQFAAVRVPLEERLELLEARIVKLRAVAAAARGYRASRMNGVWKTELATWRVLETALDDLTSTEPTEPTEPA